jgi:prepilin-type N-terminal cleavage/methylation domain-containing protein
MAPPMAPLLRLCRGSVANSKVKQTAIVRDQRTDRPGGWGMAPGFTLAELVMVIAVIGILAVMAVPSFLSYYRAAGLKSGA